MPIIAEYTTQAMPASLSLTEEAPSSVSNNLSRPPAASSPPTFKLRPRSNSQPIADVVGFAFASTSIKPQQYGIHTISPDGRIHPSAPRISADGPVVASKMPPPAFAPFLGSETCSSPIKKQKTQDRLKLLLSPDTSPSGESEYSRGDNSHSTLGSPPAASSASVSVSMFPPSLMFPSTPTDDQEVFSSSNGKRSLPPVEGNTGQEASSPFTPGGRQMMQNLCINSPSPTLSLSPTQIIGSTSSQPLPLLIHEHLSDTPNLSFSPSLKRERCCIFSNMESRSNTADSSVRETIVFSTWSTPLGTPKRSLRSCSIATSNSSPFHSLRGQRTPIGHQRGSVFKMLPPRLYPNGRDDTSSASPGTSVNTFAVSSPFSASPSPRVVPLTVLSRDGSPLISPKINMSQLHYPSSSPSPLMRSLDRVAKEDDTEEQFTDLLSPKLHVKMPNILSVQSSPMPTESHRLLPRIKLTPRVRGSFLNSKLDLSPCGDTGDSLTVPRLMQRSRRALRPAHVHPEEQYGRCIIETASSFVPDCGDEEAAEMDSLLNGFEHHLAHDNVDPNQERNEGTLGRVESEEAEMVALTQGPFQMPTLWLPPSGVTQGKNDERRSTLICSDGDSCHFSPGNHKPMPSITLNLQSGQDAHLCDTSPSFLPRQVPIAQNKCRSLFDPSKNAGDPLEQIIRADAIAEAARSNDPLTDEDSDIDGDDANFLLCLPRANQENESHYKSLKKKFPLKSSHAGFLEDSPILSPLLNNSKNGSFIRRSKCSDHSFHSLSSSPAPTIFEEDFATLEKGTSKRPYHPMSTIEGSLQGLNKRETSDETFTTFCSLSDCDVSDIMASPKYSRTKALCATKDRQSACSMLSMSSLCGLDIVHEASLGNEVNDKVPALMPSESSEFPIFAGMFKPLRSELSLNSLGLSVDSLDAGMDQRDLFTPPVAAGVARNAKQVISPRDLFTPPVGAGVRNNTQMLSPPPLRCRATSPLPFDTYQRWN